jgi:hypothetical protein
VGSISTSTRCSLASVGISPACTVAMAGDSWTSTLSVGSRTSRTEVTDGAVDSSVQAGS